MESGSMVPSSVPVPSSTSVGYTKVAGQRCKPLLFVELGVEAAYLDLPTVQNLSLFINKIITMHKCCTVGRSRDGFLVLPYVLAYICWAMLWTLQFTASRKRAAHRPMDGFTLTGQRPAVTFGVPIGGSRGAQLLHSLDGDKEPPL